MGETEASPKRGDFFRQMTQLEPGGRSFKPEQSGSLCSENVSVEKINGGVICFLAFQVICGGQTEGNG